MIEEHNEKSITTNGNITQLQIRKTSYGDNTWNRPWQWTTKENGENVDVMWCDEIAKNMYKTMTLSVIIALLHYL